MAPASEASSQERQLPQQGAEEPTDLWEAGMGNSLLAGLPGACRVPMCIQPPQVRLKTGHPAGPHLNLRSLPGAKTATSLPTAQVSCSQPASSGATFLPAGAISVQTESTDTCDQDRRKVCFLPSVFSVGREHYVLLWLRHSLKELRSLSAWGLWMCSESTCLA